MCLFDDVLQYDRCSIQICNDKHSIQSCLVNSNNNIKNSETKDTRLTNAYVNYYNHIRLENNDIIDADYRHGIHIYIIACVNMNNDAYSKWSDKLLKTYNYIQRDQKRNLIKIKDLLWRILEKTNRNELEYFINSLVLDKYIVQTDNIYFRRPIYKKSD